LFEFSDNKNRYTVPVDVFVSVGLHAPTNAVEIYRREKRFPDKKHVYRSFAVYIHSS